MKKRSLFSKIFKTENSVSYGQDMQLLNDYQAVFTNYNKNIYDNQTARSCIDAIAKNGAKLNPKHIVSKSKLLVQDKNSNIKTLISKRPNEFMSAYDMYYKVFSQLFLSNNAFIYIEKDKDTGKPKALYPLVSGYTELLEYKNMVFVRFTFLNGNQYTVSYDDVIHLRRFFCDKDLGGSDTRPLNSALEFQHTMREGIINAIKTTSSIKGILKTTKAMIKEEDIKKTLDRFRRDFMDSETSNGIVALDSMSDFKPVSITPETATDKQMEMVKDEILEYFGISEEILKSTYTEDQWNAFYESVLEPVAIQISQEMTQKMFTSGERSNGNEIVFEANRLQYASNKTKIEVAKQMNNYMTINEIREIFNLAPVEDGDRVLQDLNHIDSTKANEYQVGKQKEKEDDQEGGQDSE